MDQPGRWVLGYRRYVRAGLGWTILVVGVAWLTPPAVWAAPLDLLREAAQLEDQGRWVEACELYEQILHEDRNTPEVRARLQNCWRHIHQIRRHRDASFRQQVQALSVTQALNVYAEVLAKLQTNHVDRDKVHPERLFRQGLEELTLALTDETFRQEYLPTIDREMLRTFRGQLRENWLLSSVRDPREARNLLQEIALAARKELGLKPAATVFEFVCGACNSLDEYTLYLTPAKLQEEAPEVGAELVGVGLDVQYRDGKWLVISVVADGPAGLAGIRKGDRLLRINRQKTDELTAETGLGLLRGEAGSVVELEILAADENEVRVIKLVRQSVLVPSVSESQLLEPGIGYVHLVGFHKSTVQEMEDAILRLQTVGMRVMILDLRGNPGGLFKVAVQVAERFLAQGVIVSTQSQLRQYTKIYEAHSGQSALDLPLIVLVDGDTASAAEVVAGALQENQRATVIGQTTYGKGSIQCVMQLSSAAAGIRITLARFYSPRGHMYNGAGITPDIVEARGQMDMMGDRQLERALQEAGRLYMMR